MIKRFVDLSVSLAAGAMILCAPAHGQALKRPPSRPKEAAEPRPAAKDAKVQREARAREIVVREQAAAKNMESEYADRMRPFVFLEIRFAAAACELSKEQRQLIAKRAKPMIDELAKELAKQEPEKEGHTKAIANGGLDPQRRVLETLAAIIRNQVSSERWERYQREVQKRAAHRKRSTIDNLVAALDRDLILSQKERQALAGVLLDEWKEEWSWNTEILVDFEAWLPLISHQRIASILSETQRKALKNRSVRAPNPWEIFVLAAEIFEFTRTAEEEEIENASGFAADRR